MSKKFEQIGRISAAVIALPESHLGIALDVINRLADKRWKVRLLQVLREGLSERVKGVRPLSACAVFLNEKISLDGYFVTRNGLVVQEGFSDTFSFDLRQDHPQNWVLLMHDFEQDGHDWTSLNQSHGRIFEHKDFLYVLASMLSKQWTTDDKGPLFSDGSWNSFRVWSKGGERVYVVSVSWNFQAQAWVITYKDENEYTYVRGEILFSCK